MTAIPNPETAREIAREAIERSVRHRDYIGPAITDHDVMGEILASGDRSAWGRWNDAVRAEMETAAVTVSWPAEQPQNDGNVRAVADAVVRLKAWLAGRQANVHSEISTTNVIAEPRDRSTASWAIAESDVAAVVAALEARTAKES